VHIKNIIKVEHSLKCKTETVQFFASQCTYKLLFENDVDVRQTILTTSWNTNLDQL